MKLDEKLFEIVVLLPSDGYLVIGVESSKVEDIMMLIKEATESWITKKEFLMVRINGHYGPAYFPNSYVLGFYSRVAKGESQKVFQEKLIEIAERQTKAAEKIAGECDHGEEWRG